MPQRRLSITILFADLAWSVVSMTVALALRYGFHWSPLDRDQASQMYPFFGAACLLWILFSLVLPLDGFRGGWRLSAVVSHSLLAVCTLVLVLLSGGYLVRSYVSRLVLVQFSLLLFAGFVQLRIAFYLSLRARLKNGGVQRIVIMGSGRLARELARKIERHPEMLCRVVGLLSPDDGTGNSGFAEGSNLSCTTTTLGVVQLLAEQQTDEVILVLNECASPDLLSLAALCRERGIRVSLVPQFYELYLSRFHLTDLDGLPVLRLAKPGPSIPALIVKRMFDLVVGTLLSLLSVPILILVAVALHYVKGKAFCWETRCGFQGKPFAMLRLNVNRIASNGPRFEAVLREFSLTELPQLFNVLRGDMSLVGPRPESRDRVCRYSEWQQQRLAVKPGMTGLAQVQGLREQHSSEEKTRFDLQYLQNCSIWSDLSLMLQTLWTLATRPSRRGDIIADVSSPRTPNKLDVPPKERDLLENAHRS